ncbi:hypothetical protein ScPMuIL_001961 [Solemya velum]
MAIFLQEDIHKLFLNKFVVIIGSSVQRTIYKDFVVLLQGNRYMTDSEVRSKGELSFAGDELLEGGRKQAMHNGTSYREVRQYKSDYHLVRFYFITKCYNQYVESVLSDLGKEPKPDIVILNSCLWDITRYGNCAVDSYKQKLENLFIRLQEVLTKDCLIIWNTTMPVSKNAKGGVLIPEVEFLKSTLSLEILEANFFSRELAVSHGLDVLDLHFFLRHHLHRHAKDGIHWDMTTHRRITNLFLTHIAESWGVELPGHTEKLSSQKSKDSINQTTVMETKLGNKNLRNQSENKKRGRARSRRSKLSYFQRTNSSESHWQGTDYATPIEDAYSNWQIPQEVKENAWNHQSSRRGDFANRRHLRQRRLTSQCNQMTPQNVSIVNNFVSFENNFLAEGYDPYQSGQMQSFADLEDFCEKYGGPVRKTDYTANQINHDSCTWGGWEQQGNYESQVQHWGPYGGRKQYRGVSRPVRSHRFNPYPPR